MIEQLTAVLLLRCRREGDAAQKMFWCVSLLCTSSALYATCLYYLVLDMNSVLTIYCFYVTRGGDAAQQMFWFSMGLESLRW